VTLIHVHAHVGGHVRVVVIVYVVHLINVEQHQALSQNSTLQMKSNQIYLRQKQAECNVTTERMCRWDMKAVQNGTNRCPKNTN